MPHQQRVEGVTKHLYIKQCRRCHDPFHTNCKHPKYCEKCKNKHGTPKGTPQSLPLKDRPDILKKIKEKIRAKNSSTS